MDDGSLQVSRALIADVEYRFIEKLASATKGSEVVVCETPDGARRYATCETWEAGRALFETCQADDEGVVTSASSSAEKLALFNSLFAMRSDVYAKSYFNKKVGRVGYSPACGNEWERVSWDEALDFTASRLRAIIEDALMGTMFDLPSRSDVAKVVVTPEVISEGKEPTLVPGEPKRKLPAGKTRREGDSAAANRRPSVS